MVAPEAGAHERGEADAIPPVEQLVSHVGTVLDYTFNQVCHDLVVAVVRGLVQGSPPLSVRVA